MLDKMCLQHAWTQAMSGSIYSYQELTVYGSWFFSAKRYQWIYKTISYCDFETQMANCKHGLFLKSTLVQYKSPTVSD